MTGEGPSAPASGAPASSDSGRIGARLPTAMRLLGVAVRAFDVTRQRPPDCVLRSETVRRGLSGERCTERWCCPLTAFVEHLLESGLVTVPSVPAAPARAHVAIFVPLAAEMIWWERMRESGRDAGGLAHFRHFVAGAAYRVGALLGAHSTPVPGFVTSGAWAVPERRTEPLRMMFALAGNPPLRVAQKGIGYDEDTLASWVKHGQKPSAPAIDALAGYFAKRVEVLPIPHVRAWLSWHYALAQIGDALAEVVGREAVAEAADVFARLSTCLAASVRQRVASGEILPETALAFFLRSEQSTPAVPEREAASGEIDLLLLLRPAEAASRRAQAAARSGAPRGPRPYCSVSQSPAASS